jgi:hypothetical protein
MGPLARWTSAARRHAASLAGARAGGVACLAVWAFFLATGFMGVDFGNHWDEWYQLAGLKDCVDKATWLPQRYVYGGLYFALGLPVLLGRLHAQLPGAVGAAWNAATVSLDPAAVAEIQQLQKSARELIDAPEFLLAERGVFLVVASAAIPFVYLACRRLSPQRRLTAVAATAFMALSWEFQYHARVVAVDAPLAAVVALQLLLVCDGLADGRSSEQTSRLVGAALAGGCALGFKATGLFTFIPVLIAPWVAPGARPLRDRVGLAALCVAGFWLAAFATSPASFLDPLRALATLSYARHDYNAAADAHTNFVTGAGDHLVRLSLWLTTAVPSASPARSVLLTVVSAIGVPSLARRHPRVFAVWLPFLVGYLAFMLGNRLLVVRQYLLLVPFFAVAFGHGTAQLAEWLGRLRLPRAGRALLPAALALAVLLNASWLYAAARSIKTTTAATIQADFMRDLARLREPVLVSPGLRDALKADLEAGFLCDVPNDDARASIRQVAFKFTEHDAWNGNRLGVLAHTYGARDFNYDWYITFPGKLRSERIMRVSSTFAKTIELDTKAFLRCVAK